MPARSVDAYGHAEQMGDTLSMSNLAEKLISAGFLVEAQDECDKALKSENIHENVGRTLARLKGISAKEDKQEEEVVQRARPKSDFYNQFGRAAARTEPNTLPESWEGPNCMLNATLVGADFKAVGSCELPSALGLAAALGATFGLAAKSAPDRFRVEYRGTLRGCAIQRSVTRTKEGEPPKTLLASLDDTSSVSMVLTDDGRELKVMESPLKDTPQFYVLKSKEKVL
jgi:hypothetical protein